MKRSADVEISPDVKKYLETQRADNLGKELNIDSINTKIEQNTINKNPKIALKRITKADEAHLFKKKNTRK